MRSSLKILIFFLITGGIAAVSYSAHIIHTNPGLDDVTNRMKYLVSVCSSSNYIPSSNCSKNCEQFPLCYVQARLCTEIWDAQYSGNYMFLLFAGIIATAFGIASCIPVNYSRRYYVDASTPLIQGNPTVAEVPEGARV